MFLGGNINLQGPEFEKKKVLFESDICGEFYLDMEKAAQLAIKRFDVWVQMEQDKEVSILTTHEVDENDEGFLNITIKTKKGDELTLTISIKQASILAQVCEQFRQLYYADQALKKEHKIELI